MTKLSNIRRVGIHAYRFKLIAKLMCKRLCKQNRTTYWVLSEPGCHTVLCFTEIEKINKLLRNQGSKAKPMNAVILNNICSYRMVPVWLEKGGKK